DAARCRCRSTLSPGKSWCVARAGCFGNCRQFDEWCAERIAWLFAEQPSSRERIRRAGYASSSSTASRAAASFSTERSADGKLQRELPEGFMQLQWISVE